MARKYLVDIDLQGNTIKNFKLDKVREVELENLSNRSVGELLNVDDRYVVLITEEGDKIKRATRLASHELVALIQATVTQAEDTIRTLTQRLTAVESRDVYVPPTGEELVVKVKSSSVKLDKSDIEGLTATLQELTSTLTSLTTSVGQIDNKDLDTLRNAKAYTDSIKTQLLDSASDDFDTFKEIEQFIKQNTEDIRALGSVANKFVTEIGDGSTLEHTIQHNLNTRDVVISLRMANAPYEQVVANVECIDENSIKISTRLPILSDDKVVATVLG